MKLVVIGDNVNSNKTHLLSLYTQAITVEDIKNNAYLPIFNDSYEKIKNNTLWNTTGSEELSNIRKLTYADTHIFILVYAVEEGSSFRNIRKKWVPEIAHEAPTVPFLLVSLRHTPGLQDKKPEVSVEQGNELASELGVTLIQCDMHNIADVNAVFDTAIMMATSSSHQNRHSQAIVSSPEEVKSSVTSVKTEEKVSFRESVAFYKNEILEQLASFDRDAKYKYHSTIRLAMNLLSDIKSSDKDSSKYFLYLAAMILQLKRENMTEKLDISETKKNRLSSYFSFLMKNELSKSTSKIEENPYLDLEKILAKIGVTIAQFVNDDQQNVFINCLKGVEQTDFLQFKSQYMSKEKLNLEVARKKSETATDQLIQTSRNLSPH